LNAPDRFPFLRANPGERIINQKRVVIAMSGGVDSSVAAALLVEQGYDVIGIMLRLWSEPGQESNNRCCTPDAMALAKRVAAHLGIPFYAIDARQPFHQTVVRYFEEGYAQGETPNPCLKCNRHIRWGLLFDHALALGASYMATGHYARLRENQGGRIELLRAVDNAKDQSYILHVLNQSQLCQTIFPIGQFSKTEIRQLARKFDLPVAERADSQDLCFLGDGDYRQYLLRNTPTIQNPGPILNRDDEILGEHQGLAFYTIGQRKGLGVYFESPRYVLEKDVQRNALIIGEVEELGKRDLVAKEVNWISGSQPEHPMRAQVKIRYKAKDAWATISPLADHQVQVQFDEPLRDITPGQAAVFYDEIVCLGGGIIQPG
jgi:tRNA-specific 2-thiouridylase